MVVHNDDKNNTILVVGFGNNGYYLPINKKQGEEASMKYEFPKDFVWGVLPRRHRLKGLLSKMAGVLLYGIYLVEFPEK